jgi:hypothetical protein
MHVAYCQVRGLSWNVDYAQRVGVFYAPGQGYCLSYNSAHYIYGFRVAM